MAVSRCCLVLIVAILLSGVIVSAGDDDLEPVSVQLQWVTQAQFAGYYVARELGFYADEGLDVTIIESEGDLQPVEVVAAGDAELGVTWLPKTLKSNEGGANLVNIAQIFQRSGTVLVSFAEAGIKSAFDLPLHRIGVWVDDNEYEVHATTFHIGSDPTSGEHLMLVPQPFHLGPLLAGELDVAQALIYNGVGRLYGEINPASGELFQPDDLNIIDLNEVGTAMLQDHIIARADWLAEEDNEAVAIAFLKATIRAWIHCRDHADDCVQILLEIDPDLGESHQQWQMNEVNKLIWPAPAGIGIMDEALWDQTVEWLLTLDALAEEPLAGSYRGDLVSAALSSLEAEDLDVTGAGWQPTEVIMRAGGA
ncbi:MAG: ABC transporter substrate-binding protein [Chloroflexi bacterium]|nr:ABC transporter substrate-binding protein [Chloroflexota bacterium]